MNNPATRPPLRSLDIPVPPENIRYRVTSTPIDEAAFLQAGECCASEILRSLDLAGIDAGGFRSVLDFGCGCSRVLRFLRPHLAQASFHGFDVDEVAIEWSRRHIDGVRFDVVPHLPPTDCPRGSFDFIYGLSVFSHLDLPRQLLWLEELQRILRPDGLMLLTIHGRVARDLVEGTITEQEKREFDATGFLFVSNIADNVLPDWYQTAIYREDFARFVFGSRFEILRFEAMGMGGCQDVLVLRNRAVQAHPGGLAPDLDHVFDAVCRIAPACRGTLSADTPLGDGGVGLDSIGFLELVLDVEKRTGVRLRDEHLTAATLATAGTLARHIHLARTTRHE